MNLTVAIALIVASLIAFLLMTACEDRQKWVPYYSLRVVACIMLVLGMLVGAYQPF